ncbi:MAG TPA: FIST N-terminal domain-containing protein, partial [Actinomycetota bacterium]|nr:FIST N-terminal domain-containing protein [Actinomycetota bacterium]
SLDGETPQLTLLFFSVHHLPLIDQIAEVAAKAAAPGTLLGCTAQAVVGDGREIEQGPALSVWTANLGAAVIEPFTIATADTEDGPTALGLPAIDAGTRAVILLGDPYTFPPDVLGQLSGAAPGVPIVGGMASGGRGPGRHALVLDGEVRTFGVVGVTLGGAVRIETLVSQGCRPIGTSYIVTAAEGNVIRSLAGAPPLERLRDIFTELSPEDQERANRGLHIGMVIDEYATEFGQGDFLIRNVIGADQDTGAVAVGDDVRVGQTVQFHIRDASAADEDLRNALGVLELSRTGDPSSLAGALLFTCNGRGSHLFGTPDHDIQTVRRSIGQLPVAGMFCAGELGPVGGRNFLHGFTASLALFVAPGPPD